MKIKNKLGALVFTMLLAGSLMAAGHSTVLSWTASTDIPGAIPAGSGYNVYRSTGACPATGSPTSAVKLNTAVVAALTFTDSTVTAGQWCYYATTLLNGVESVPSNSVQGAIGVLPPSNVHITSQN